LSTNKQHSLSLSRQIGASIARKCRGSELQSVNRLIIINKDDNPFLTGAGS